MGMICFSRLRNVLLLPCRHCSVCHPCLRSMRDEKCPLCRSAFSSYITFPISKSPSPAEAHLAQTVSIGACCVSNVTTNQSSGVDNDDTGVSVQVEATVGESAACS